MKRPLAARLPSAILLALPIVASAAQQSTQVPAEQAASEASYMASERAQARQRATEAFDNFRGEICDQLDLEMSLDDNPFVYTNPDAGCDLGLSMPGLPNMGLGLGSIDSCKLLQSVTGDMVDSINEQLQGAVDGALDSVGGDLEYEVDLGEMAEDVVGEDVGSGQSTDVDIDDAIRDSVSD